MAVETDHRLGCGRDIDDVWSHADAPPTTHELSCADCQAARRSLTQLNDATEHLKTQDRDDPDLHLASDIVDKVTAIARSEVRRGARIPLERSEDSTTELSISEQAIATVIRHTSDLIPGIETRSVALRLHEEDGPEISSVKIAVRLRVTVSATSSIIDQVALLRARLMGAIQVEVGLDTTRIDVLVEDLSDV